MIKWVLSLLTTQEQRARKAAERQLAIRMNQKKVQKYVSGCREMAKKYENMARQAVMVNDVAGSKRYLVNRMLNLRQADKWGAYLLRMDDLVLRGQMADAMRGLIDGIQVLTKQINVDINMEEMQRAAMGLNQANMQLDQAEEKMSFMFENMDIHGHEQELSSGDIPQELQGEVEEAFQLMLRDLSGQPVSSGLEVSTKNRDTEFDAEIAKGRERIKKIRDLK